MKKWVIYSCVSCGGLTFAIPAMDAHDSVACPHCAGDDVVLTGECLNAQTVFDNDDGDCE